jgi:hypothetical protein
MWILGVTYLDDNLTRQQASATVKQTVLRNNITYP